MAIKQSHAIKELKRRAAESKETAAVLAFSIKDFCFPEQLAFALEKKIIKTACTSRRGGKTNAIIADFIDTCQSETGVTCLYLTLTIRSARTIIWNELKLVVKKYNLDVTPNEVTLEMRFNKTMSVIRCGGAKDESEIEKYRGLKLRKAYIDECQSFRPYLRTLINDILLPALRDLNGELGLTGTPGPVPAGPFFEYCHMPNIPNHKWNAFHNPHMHNPEGKYNLPEKDLNVRLKEERELKGITENDASYRRETYGEWIEDKDALVFKFNKALNISRSMPVGKMVYILGADIGYHDSDAIAILGYNFNDNKVYLVEEFVESKLGVTDFINKVKFFIDKYAPVKMVMDSGGLGKKIQEEIRQRHGIHMEAASKERKFEFIELMNDDLRTGKLMCFPGSRFEEDSMLVTWDRTDPTKLKISDTYHTDIGDAVLYAWRECKHYLETLLEPKYAKNSNEYMDALEAKEAEAMERSKMDQDDGVDEDDFNSIYE